jgi:hypothetical protein
MEAPSDRGGTSIQEVTEAPYLLAENGSAWRSLASLPAKGPKSGNTAVVKALMQVWCRQAIFEIRYLYVGKLVYKVLRCIEYPKLQSMHTRKRNHLVSTEVAHSRILVE